MAEPSLLIVETLKLRAQVVKRLNPHAEGGLLLFGHLSHRLDASLWLEDRIPSEASASRRDDLSLYHSLAVNEALWTESETEDCADLGAAILTRRCELVNAFAAESFKEPFNEWSGETVERVYRERSVFDQNRRIPLLDSRLCFGYHHLARLKLLNLGQVKVHVPHLAEHSFSLFELEAVAGDEEYVLKHLVDLVPASRHR